MNSIGNIFRFTDFGESHGPAIGGVIDGCPSNLSIDFDDIAHDLTRRAGRDNILIGSSTRASNEKDEIEWLSGIMNGKTLGTPIAFIIRNTDTRPIDYEPLKDIYREGHADYTYQTKYGIRDYRGGGRASARETAARVVAGSIAKQILAKEGIAINASIKQVGNKTKPEEQIAKLREAQLSGDSIGGIVQCRISGIEVGIGEPIFDKIQARLAYAMMSINACKGFEYGSGFGGVDKMGSEINKLSGGALGGISDGTDFEFRCVFKPTPSRASQVKGRHDVCVALRTPVIVEAMAAMTILDLLMEQRGRFLRAEK